MWHGIALPMNPGRRGQIAQAVGIHPGLEGQCPGALGVAPGAVGRGAFAEGSQPFAVGTDELAFAPGFHQVDVVGAAAGALDSDPLLAVAAAAVIVDVGVGLFGRRVLRDPFAAGGIMAVIRGLEGPVALPGLGSCGNNARRQNGRRERRYDK